MSKSSPKIVRAVAAATLLAVAALSPLVARSAPADRASISLYESGLTRPYEERKLQFNQPAVVRELMVKVGDTVQADQVLAQQDISIEMAERKGLEIEATSHVQEDFATADKGVNMAKYDRLADLLKTGSSSKFETEEARIAVERSEASIKIAIEERAKADTKIKGIDARIALKTLKSPVSGFVQMIDTGVGEVGGIDQQKPSMVVVQNDPLKVDVFVPIRNANKLSVGQTLQVQYLDEDNAQWQPAKVLSMLPVAESKSQTRTVVLELPNPNSKPAGLRVNVKLADAPGGAAAGNANAGAK